LIEAKSRGEKKPPDLLAVFSGILGAFRALLLLSIRQRSEIPKEVKVKLGGQHGLERKQLVKKVLGFITRPGAA
jgi:hypothetical protein